MVTVFGAVFGFRVFGFAPTLAASDFDGTSGSTGSDLVKNAFGSIPKHEER